MNLELDDLTAALRPLVFHLYFVVRRETPQHQLTLAQGAVLTELANAGPSRMTRLADTAGVRLPSMTDVVGRMERLGLVGREPDPRDRRAVLVRLTEHGTELYTELVAAREAFLRSQLSGLPENDRAAIAEAIPALWRLLQVRSDAGRAGITEGDLATATQEPAPPEDPAPPPASAAFPEPAQPISAGVVSAR